MRAEIPKGACVEFPPIFQVGIPMWGPPECRYMCSHSPFSPQEFPEQWYFRQLSVKLKRLSKYNARFDFRHNPRHIRRQPVVPTHLVSISWPFSDAICKIESGIVVKRFWCFISLADLRDPIMPEISAPARSSYVAIYKFSRVWWIFQQMDMFPFR